MSSKYAQRRNTYGDLFSDEELGVARHLTNEYWRTNRCLRRVHRFDELVQDCLIHWLDVRETYNAERGSVPEDLHVGVWWRTSFADAFAT